MKTTMKFLASWLMVLALTMTSCSKDSVTGDLGPIGPKGEQGIEGEKGEKGEPGVDGAAQGIPGEKGDTGATGAVGTQGEQGVSGTDGNANVRTFKYDISTDSGSSIYQSTPELTREVIENDLILGYLFAADGRVLPIPSAFITANRVSINVIVDLGGDTSGGYYGVRFRLNDDSGGYEIHVGEFVELKVIIAKSSSITTGKSEATNVLTHLKSSGVDLDDYYAVMDYFELTY